MTSWRHRDVIVTCNAITGAIGHNINPNVNQGFHHTGKSLDHLTHMLQKCHDVMSWHHDVIVTCKTNQNINLIPNLFPGFYYMGRSLGHFKTCCRQPFTSWHDVMTWRHDVIVTSSWHAMLLQALLDIILIRMWIRDSTIRVSHWITWHTCYKNVMTSCHDIMTLLWHAKLIKI